MRLRQVGAGLLTYLTACAGTPRALYPDTDPYEAQLAAARYELHVLTADTGASEPVQVNTEDFQRAMRGLAREVRPPAQPAQTAHWLMEGSLQADLLAEVERGRVVRMMPLEDDSPLETASAAELKRKYLGLCQQEYGGGDCLGLLADGPILTREDLRTLGLALALKGVLRETGVALKGMVSPQALVAMVVWTCCLYLMLWLLPEPVSKLVAASMTVALLAWLPVHTLWSLMDGWGRLVHEVDRATSYEQVEEASAKFGRVMGENTAHVLVHGGDGGGDGGRGEVQRTVADAAGLLAGGGAGRGAGPESRGGGRGGGRGSRRRADLHPHGAPPRGPGGRGSGGSCGGAGGCHRHHPPPGRQPAGLHQRPALARAGQQVHPGDSGERPCGGHSPESGAAHSQELGAVPN